MEQNHIPVSPINRICLAVNTRGQNDWDKYLFPKILLLSKTGYDQFNFPKRGDTMGKGLCANWTQHFSLSSAAILSLGRKKQKQKLKQREH